MKQEYIPSKQRYDILDGLRGVAAIMVLVFHHFDLFGGMDAPLQAIVGHGYMAVDFFFILSGYVISYAYDDRWDKMSTWGFIKRRIIRLQPMVVIGTIVAMLLFYFGRGDLFPLIGECSVWKLLLIGFLGMLMIPVPGSMDIRGWGEMYPINGNMWSLLFEYIGSLLYAVFIRHLGKKLLILLVAICAVLTLTTAMEWDFTGLVGNRADYCHTIVGGFSLDASQMYLGFVRLAFPFTCGILLARLGKTIRVKGGFWISALILIAIVSMPRTWVGGAGVGNGIYECLCIFVLFPIIVTMGAGSSVSGATAKICKFLGEISYPLYAVQYAVVYTMLGGWKSHNPDATTPEIICVSIASMLLGIGISYLCLKIFDEPVREYLKKRWFKTSK